MSGQAQQAEQRGSHHTVCEIVLGGVANPYGGLYAYCPQVGLGKMFDGVEDAREATTELVRVVKERLGADVEITTRYDVPSQTGMGMGEVAALPTGKRKGKGKSRKPESGGQVPWWD